MYCSRVDARVRRWTAGVALRRDAGRELVKRSPASHPAIPKTMTLRCRRPLSRYHPTTQATTTTTTTTTTMRRRRTVLDFTSSTVPPLLALQHRAPLTTIRPPRTVLDSIPARPRRRPLGPRPEALRPSPPPPRPSFDSRSTSGGSTSAASVRLRARRRGVARLHAGKHRRRRRR